MVDRIQPLKLEDPGSGGVEIDEFPTASDPHEDFLDCRGVSIQSDTSDDDAVLVSRDASGNMTLKDAVVGTKTLTQIQAPGGAHKTTHENGGGDEISVAGLSGELADAQPPKTHKASHENGGGDELSVAGLSGELADAQPPKAHGSAAHSGTIGTESQITFDNSAGHAHTGTDSKAVDHTNLGSKGTNTHAQLDSHVASTSNPHSVTKTQVGLGNVTDDAQLKRADNDFGGFTLKATPAANDILLIEDSAASWAKKKATVGSIGGGGGDWDGQQVYYVGKHGSDSNDGKCDKLAFLTVAAAIAAVNAQTPGPTNRFVIRIVDAGIYAEGGITIPAYTLIHGPAATIRGDITFSNSSHAHLYKVIYVYRMGYTRALYFAGAAGEEASAQIDYVDSDQTDAYATGLHVASGTFELEVGEIRSTHATVGFGNAVAVVNGGSIDAIAYVKANQLIGVLSTGTIRCVGGGAGSGKVAQCYVEAGYIYGTDKTLHANAQGARICAKVGGVAASATYNAVYFTNANAGPIILTACVVDGAIGTSNSTPWLVINEVCGYTSSAGFNTTSGSYQDVLTLSMVLSAGKYAIRWGGTCYNGTSGRGWSYRLYDNTNTVELDRSQKDAADSATDKITAGGQYVFTQSANGALTLKTQLLRVGSTGTAYVNYPSIIVTRLP